MGSDRRGRLSPAPGRGRYDRSLSRVERQAAQRRRLVAAAALALEEIGAANLTVTDVVRRAKMGRNTFYAHFDNLDDVVGEVREQAIDALLAPVLDAIERARTPVERLRALAAGWLTAAAGEPVFARAALSHVVGADPSHLGSRATSRLVDLLESIIQHGCELGALSDRGDPFRAWVVASAVAGAGLRVAAVGREPGDAETLAEVVVRALR